MHPRVLKLCAWSGPAFLVLFAIGMVPLAGFLPPPTAHVTPQEAVQVYAEHNDRVKAGLSLMFASTLFLGPWTGAVVAQLRGLGERGHAVTYGFLASGAAQVIVVGLPVLIMIVAAFRPTRDPDVVLALHDIAWILFIMNWAPLAAMMALLAAAGLGARTEVVFPRWFGYFNAWCVVALLPATLIPFFTRGPFAWQGAFEFWLAAVVFFGWMLVVSVVNIRFANAQPDRFADA